MSNSNLEANEISELKDLTKYRLDEYTVVFDYTDIKFLLHYLHRLAL